MEKPFYLVKIDEEDDISGVSFISLVDSPAMEVSWMALSEDENICIKLDLTADVDKKLLYGVFIVADKFVYRKKLYGYVKFTKEDIEKIVKKWSKSNFNKNINIQHTDKMVEAFVREQWIVEDKNNDKMNKYMDNLVEGSWVGIVEVEDETFWKNYIKSGDLTGFSIEILPSNLIKGGNLKVETEDFAEEINEKVMKDKLYELLFKDSGSVDEIYNNVKKLFNI
jgi:hypothetical protein